MYLCVGTIKRTVVGGHAFIVVDTSGTGDYGVKIHGMPETIIKDCKGKIAKSKQLLGRIETLSKKELEKIEKSVAKKPAFGKIPIPKFGFTVCWKYEGLPLAPRDIVAGMVKKSQYLKSCCLPYDGTAPADGSGYNSNNFAYTLLKDYEKHIGALPDKLTSHVMPGWGKLIPDCEKEPEGDPCPK